VSRSVWEIIMKFNIACILAQSRGRVSAGGIVTLYKSDGSRFDCE